MTKVVNIAQKVRFLLPPERSRDIAIPTPPALAQQYKRKVPRTHPSRSTDAPPVEEGADPLELAPAGIPLSLGLGSCGFPIAADF